MSGAALFYGLDTGKHWEAFFAWVSLTSLALAIDAHLEAQTALQLQAKTRSSLTV